MKQSLYFYSIVISNILEDEILPTNRARTHFSRYDSETIFDHLDHKTKLIVYHNADLVLLHLDNQDDHNDYEILKRHRDYQEDHEQVKLVDDNV